MKTKKLDQRSLEEIREIVYVAPICDILDELGFSNQAGKSLRDVYNKYKAL